MKRRGRRWRKNESLLQTVGIGWCSPGLALAAALAAALVVAALAAVLVAALVVALVAV